MNQSLSSEIEELLLDCYISTVIKGAKKKMQSNNHLVKQVHFGSQLHVSVREFSINYSGQFDDTLPIENQFPEDLGMDSFSSQDEMNDDVDLHSGMWSERNNQQQIQMESYEEFLIGAQKRLHTLPGDSIDISPNRKKIKITDDDDDDDNGGDATSCMRCSTPPDVLNDNSSLAQLEDVLMFIKYHVESYAINAHANSLKDSSLVVSKPPLFPNASSENAKLFWNLCSSPPTTFTTSPSGIPKSDDEMKKSSPIKKLEFKETSSFGVTLARDILKQRQKQPQANKEQCSMITNTKCKNDFESESSYRKFLHERDAKIDLPKVMPQNVPLSKEPLTTSRCRMPTVAEIDLYLMPEADEAHHNNSISVMQHTSHLEEEYISDDGFQLPKQPLSLEQFIDQKITDKKEQKFRSAFALTQEEVTEDSFSDDEMSPSLTTTNQSPLITSSSQYCIRKEESPMDELFATQSSLSDEGHNLEEGARGEWHVNNMLSELMASQAMWGTQQQTQQQRHHDAVRSEGIFYKPGNEFGGGSPSGYDEDGVVPQIENERESWTNDDVMFHEEGQKTTKMTKSLSSKGCGDQPVTPSYRHNNTTSFNWSSKSEDEAVVPSGYSRGMSSSSSPIITPQRLRLGLSKKLKIQRALHPYKK